MCELDLIFHMDKVLVIKHLFQSVTNKLAKARKMRKLAGTFGLKKFGPGKLWVTKNVGKKVFGSKSFCGSNFFWGGQNSFFGSKKFFWVKKKFYVKKVF